MAQTPPPPPDPKKHLFTEEMKEAKEQDRMQELQGKPSIFSELTTAQKLGGLASVIVMIVALFVWLAGC